MGGDGRAACSKIRQNRGRDTEARGRDAHRRMSDSSLREESDAALCERCGQRESTATTADVMSVDGVLSPPMTLEVCAECLAELRDVPFDAVAYCTQQTPPAPRGVLAKVRWTWRLWRFRRAVRRAGIRRDRP